MRSRDAPPWIIRPTASCTASAVTPPAPAASSTRIAPGGGARSRGGGGGTAGSEAAAAAAADPADPDAPLAAATASASAARSAAASAASSAASASSPARTSSGARFSTNAPESSSCASNRLDARWRTTVARKAASSVAEEPSPGVRSSAPFPLASAMASAIPLRTVASGTATLAPSAGRSRRRAAGSPNLGAATTVARSFRGGPAPALPGPAEAHLP